MSRYHDLRKELRKEWTEAKGEGAKHNAFFNALNVIRELESDLLKAKIKEMGLDAAYNLALDKCSKFKDKNEKFKDEAIHKRDLFHQGEPYLFSWE